MSRHMVALDTNVFLLLLVGLANREAIARHRRLSAYSAESFEFLCRLLAGFDEIVVTPGCLAETTNLLDSDKGSRVRCYQVLKELIRSGDEFSEKRKGPAGHGKPAGPKQGVIVRSGTIRGVSGGRPARGRPSRGPYPRA